ncbi:hypothetical protein KY312_01585, partial [Candidatus Woesearchaeota archaeon]|nr:hypothetical protein [Candidatus Woesearchaeota archaeon]
MKFKSKNIAIRAGTFYVAVFHVDDAKDLDLWPTDRVEMRKGKRMITCIIDVARGEKVVRPGTVALYYETSQKLKTNPFDAVEVLPMPTPPSVRFIKQKLDGKQLNYEQMHEIIKAISENDLTDTEMTYFISACYNKGLSIREIEHLTKAMVVTGDIMKPAKSPVFDKHCLTEDTPLVFRFNNKIMVEPIGKLVEILEIHQKYKPKNGAWSMPISRNIQVLVFNENGKTNFAKATELFKARAPRELNKLVLKGNKEIKLTSDHTVFVLKNGQIINLPVSKINKGDFVVVPSGHSVKKRKLLKSNNLILNKKSLSSFLTLLGFYVAEGFSNYQGFFLNFGSHEKNLIKESMQCIKQVFRINPTINIPHPTARRVCVYRKNLSAFFEGLGCGKNALEKRIPSFIF